MKTKHILATIAMLLMCSCASLQIEDDNKDCNIGEISPLLSIEYPSVRSTLQLPIYSYGPSILLIRARNGDERQ